MSATRDVITRIETYLGSTTDTCEKCVSDILQLDISVQSLSCILWTFISITNTNGPYNEDAQKSLFLLCGELSYQLPELKNYLFICLDMINIKKIGLESMEQFQKYSSSLRYQSIQINRSQSLSQRPEGFSNLIVALLQDENPDLKEIIGKFALDPCAVILLIFDLLEHQTNGDSARFYKLLNEFDLNQVLNFILYKSETGFHPGIIGYLFYLFNENVIDFPQQLKILKHLKGLLVNLRKNYYQSVNSFCAELAKPKTYFPSQPKSQQRTPAYRKAENEYLQAKEILYKSPYIEMMLRSLNEKSIKKFIQYDPCSIPSVAKFVTQLLLQRVIDDPNNFLADKNNIEMLSNLSCHCTDSKLLALVCKLDNVPPYVYSNFILPSLNFMQNISWPLSFLIFDGLKKFPFEVRCQIYEKYTSNIEQICDLKILVSHIKGRMLNVSKRLAGDSASRYSGKVAKQFMRAPHVVAQVYFEMVTNFSNTPEFLVISLGDISVLALDFLLWIFTKNLPFDKVPSWINKASEFFGKLAADQYSLMDLSAFLKIIKIGLSKKSISHAIMLSHFIRSMTGIGYSGFLLQNEIQIRTGENLPRLNLRLKSLNENQETLLDRSSYLTKIFLDDDLGLHMLSYLDNMYQSIYLSKNVSEEFLNLIDNIRFTFLSLCEFLTFDNLTPIDLIQKFSFSYFSAFHINCNKDCDIDFLASENISKSLFSYFWKYTIKHLRVPKTKFEELIKDINKIIDEIKEENDDKTTYQLIQMQIQTNQEKQMKYVEAFKEKIKSVCNDWFNNENDYISFVRYCIIPRSTFSQMDAIYTAAFINRIAHLSSSFSLEKLFDYILLNIHFIIYSCTYEESRCFGLFFKKILKLVNKREEEFHIHEKLMEKVELLLKKRSSLLNVIRFLNEILKYFPLKKEHKEKILSLLDINENNSIFKTFKNIVKGSLKNEYISPIQKNKLHNNASNESEIITEDNANNKEDRKATKETDSLQENNLQEGEEKPEEVDKAKKSEADKLEESKESEADKLEEPKELEADKLEKPKELEADKPEESKESQTDKPEETKGSEADKQEETKKSETTKQEETKKLETNRQREPRKPEINRQEESKRNEYYRRETRPQNDYRKDQFRYDTSRERNNRYYQGPVRSVSKPNISQRYQRDEQDRKDNYYQRSIHGGDYYDHYYRQ